jgi:hypothetical protein
MLFVNLSASRHGGKVAGKTYEDVLALVGNDPVAAQVILLWIASDRRGPLLLSEPARCL